MDCSPLSSSVHGISQARILEWVAVSFSRGSSWPRDWAHISCIAGRFFTSRPPGKLILLLLLTDIWMSWALTLRQEDLAFSLRWSLLSPQHAPLRITVVREGCSSSPLFSVGTPIHSGTHLISNEALHCSWSPWKKLGDRYLVLCNACGRTDGWSLESDASTLGGKFL